MSTLLKKIITTSVMATFGLLLVPTSGAAQTFTNVDCTPGTIAHTYFAIADSLVNTIEFSDNSNVVITPDADVLDGAAPAQIIAAIEGILGVGTTEVVANNGQFEIFISLDGQALVPTQVLSTDPVTGKDLSFTFSYQDENEDDVCAQSTGYAPASPEWHEMNTWFDLSLVDTDANQINTDAVVPHTSSITIDPLAEESSFIYATQHDGVIETCSASTINKVRYDVEVAKFSGDGEAFLSFGLNKSDGDIFLLPTSSASTGDLAVSTENAEDGSAGFVQILGNGTASVEALLGDPFDLANTDGSVLVPYIYIAYEDEPNTILQFDLTVNETSYEFSDCEGGDEEEPEDDEATQSSPSPLKKSRRAKSSIAMFMSMPGATTVAQESQALCSIGYSRMIKPGAVGNDVRQVQTCMNLLGFSTGIVDGLYGKNTKNGVVEYQRHMKLKFIDGIVGPETIARFNTLVK